MWWVSFCREWRCKTGSRKKRVRVVAISSLPFVSSITVWALIGNTLTTSSSCQSVLRLSLSHSGTQHTLHFGCHLSAACTGNGLFCRCLSKTLCVIPKKDEHDLFVETCISIFGYKNNNDASWDGVPAGSWKAGMHQVSTPSMLNSFYQCNSGF